MQVILHRFFLPSSNALARPPKRKREKCSVQCVCISRSSFRVNKKSMNTTPRLLRMSEYSNALEVETSCVHFILPMLIATQILLIDQNESGKPICQRRQICLKNNSYKEKAYVDSV